MTVVFVLVMFFVSSGVAIGEDSAVEQQIADAVSPLPVSLRADATVVLEAEPGKRTVLRQGSNAMICHADPPTAGFTANCYHKSLDAFLTRWGELAAAGKSEEELHELLNAEAKAGKFKVDAGSVGYSLTGPFRKAAIPLMAVYLPNATAESTGLSTEVSHFRPWLMWGGTPLAHIMLPGQ